jgi:tyrosyl-tRNA synthetase
MGADVLAELEARGLVQDVTDREELRKLLAGESISFYSGYDPTAASMHAGNLVPLRVMRALADAGHKMIAVVGGATGMIGDPSGRSSERNLLDNETLAKNVASLHAQVKRFVSADAKIVNNRDWFGMGYLDFLRDVGKHVTVNQMLAKESVKNRIETEAGISYTEFSYMLLQAYDYTRLALDHDCRLQVGGSDQWGNILLGCDLGRKLGYPKPMYGLVAPLLLTSTGEKFGKSTGGGKVWLDLSLTSAHDFYQFWVNTPDADVGAYLRKFSFHPLGVIDEILAEHQQDPPLRVAQHALALDVTTWAHGFDAAAGAVRSSATMFGPSVLKTVDKLTSRSPAARLAMSTAGESAATGDMPTTEVPRAELDTGVQLVELLVRAKLADSKGAARRLIQQGGAYVNEERITDVAFVVGAKHLAADNGTIRLRSGKKTYHVIRAV